MRTQILLAGLLAAFLAPSASIAQNWVWNYPSTPSSILDKDGQLAFVGTHPAGGLVLVTRSGSRSLDVIHTNDQGNVLTSITTTFLRNGHSAYPSLKYTQDAQGNILITYPEGLTKLNVNGDTVWTRPLPLGATGVTPGTITTQLVPAPDGNYVFARQLYSEASGSTPQMLDLRAQKISATTGQDIWNTDLTSMFSGLTGGYGTYGPWPTLQRRPSGYFLFFPQKLVLLPENGLNPSLRPASAMISSGRATFYSRTGATIGAFSDMLYKLDDQGDIVALAQGPNNGMGSIVSIAEDSQNNLIAVQENEQARGPGQGTDYVMGLQRVSSGMQLLNSTSNLNLGANVHFYKTRFKVLVAPSGNYILAGATHNSRTATTYQLTMASMPAFAPLATKAQALTTGSLGLYPNPGAAHETVTVQLPAAGTLGLYDLLGRPCGPQRAVTGSSVTLPLPALAAGVYMLRLTAADGRRWTDRLTVR